MVCLNKTQVYVSSRKLWQLADIRLSYSKWKTEPFGRQCAYGTAYKYIKNQKVCHQVLVLTSSNTEPFSKFFRQNTRQEIC